MTAGSFYASFEGRLLVRRVCALTDTVWPSLEGKRVLTVGYATPFFRFLENKGPASITEIDFEENAEKTLALKTSEASFPFKNDTFDAIFAATVLQRARLPNTVLREMRRILKDDGSLILMTAHKKLPWQVPDSETPRSGGGVVRTGAEVSHLLADNLFTVQSQKHTLFFPSMIYQNFPQAEKADEWLSFLPLFGSFSITEATKMPAEAVAVRLMSRFKKRFLLSATDALDNVTETSLKK